jgi:hypothetical protein
MILNIRNATMTHTKEDGYIGKVDFEVAGHKEPYEIMLQSKRGKEWGYALSFLAASGPDEEIDALDVFLDEDDDAFDQLIEAAKSALRV